MNNGPQSGSIPVPGPHRRRVDAEQNRQRILEAARMLVAERGLGAVTMDVLSETAGVGKGTLYRAFGSRAGVAEALVDSAERDLQKQLLEGPPPLGPGASPGDRLAAFASAYLAFLEDNVGLLMEVEADPGARLHTGAYAVWHLHVRRMLGEAGVPGADLMAHLLLAGMAADLYHHLRRGLDTELEVIEASVREMVERLLGGRAREG